MIFVINDRVLGIVEKPAFKFLSQSNVMSKCGHSSALIFSVFRWALLLRFFFCASLRFEVAARSCKKDAVFTGTGAAHGACVSGAKDNGGVGGIDGADVTPIGPT